MELLSKIKELELIDFDYAGFEEGVWQSIAKLASTGSLRGLSMVRGADFLEKRGNIIIKRWIDSGERRTIETTLGEDLVFHAVRSLNSF